MNIKFSIQIRARIKAQIKVVALAVIVATSPSLVKTSSIVDVKVAQEQVFKVELKNTSVEIFAVDVANETVQLDMKQSKVSLLLLSLPPKQWNVNSKNADYLNREIADVILSSKTRQEAMEKSSFITRKYSVKTKQVTKLLVNTYFDNIQKK